MLDMKEFERLVRWLWAIFFTAGFFAGLGVAAWWFA